MVHTYVPSTEQNIQYSCVKIAVHYDVKNFNFKKMHRDQRVKKYANKLEIKEELKQIKMVLKCY